MLPSELAVVKVKGHTSGDEPDAVGKINADEMAKWAAEHAEFSPYQRAQNRDVETMMFVHVSCVPVFRTTALLKLHRRLITCIVYRI